MSRPLLACVVVLVIGGAVSRAQGPASDPTLALRDANAAATAGDWARVAAIVDPLLPARLQPADLAEAHRLAGLAAFFGRRTHDAEQHFVAYLRGDPDGHLDPALYPPEVVNFFDDVRTRHAAELHALRPRTTRHFALELVPPLGQYYDGERTKAVVITGLLVAFVATNLTTYEVIRSWCHDTGSTCDSSGVDHYHAAHELRILNYAAGAGAILTYAYGVYDGVSRYRRQTRDQAVVPYATPTNTGGAIGGVVGVIGHF